MSNIDIESFDEALSSDCTAENANNALCIYMCYIYGILSTSTEMIVPNFCSNLTIPTENKITQNDEIGIILGSIEFVLVLVLFMILFRSYFRKKCQTTPEEPPNTTLAPVHQAIHSRRDSTVDGIGFENQPGQIERLQNYFRNCCTNT